MKAGAPEAAGSAQQPRPGFGHHRGSLIWLCHQQDGRAAALEILPWLRSRDRAHRGQEPPLKPKLGHWEGCNLLQMTSRRKQEPWPHCQRWWLAGDRHHCWCHQLPTVVGQGLSGLGTCWRWQGQGDTVPLKRQSSSLPSRETTVQAPHPDHGRGLASCFCCFFPQSWVEAAHGQGPQSLLVQTPLGDGEMTSRFLPSPSFAGAVAGGGSSTAGKRGRSCLPCAHRAQGRKEGPFRTETTYHPRSPLTNQGRRAEKVQLLGFCFSYRGMSPAAGVSQSLGCSAGQWGT